MSEDYARQTEDIVAAELQAAQAGTLTGGLSPRSVPVAEVTGGGAALATELHGVLARYPYVRGRRARVALVSQEA
ncbi:MAG: hypothetical protein GEU88_21230, partial [Solirubrobacterales bacterium]|nr:hypothetical protein [Solirubrobacterales bacterium]